MQIVSTAWIDHSLEEFELSVGLGLHAEHGRASAAAPLRVFVLSGFDKITPAYAGHLRAGHVEVLDAEPVATAWARRLDGIGQRLNRYETFCFLRWPVLREVLAGTPFLHIDLDLFLQSPFAEVAPMLAGRTGTLGSPCFVAVSDRAWLDAWCAAIEGFAADPEGVSAGLGWKGTPQRRAIGSDQNLLGALVRSRRLTRGDLGPVAATHAIFDNPLNPRFPGAPRPMAAERRDGIDRLGGRPVLFWHMQNNFAQYAGRHLLLEHLHRPSKGRAAPPLAAPRPHAAPTAEHHAFNLLSLAVLREQRRAIAGRALDLPRILALEARTATDYLLRGVATRHFVLRGEGRFLLTAERWWEPGVFV